MTKKQKKELWNKYHDSRSIDTLKVYTTRIDILAFQNIQFAEDAARIDPFDSYKALQVLLAREKYKVVHKIVKDISEIFSSDI